MDRDQQIQQVVDDFLQRLASGQEVVDNDLLAANPSLEPELGEALRKARLVAGAIALPTAELTDAELTDARLTDADLTDVALSNSDARIEGDIEVTAALSPRTKTQSSRGLHVRCPHCRFPIEMLVDAPLSDVTCNSCGSHFSLLGSDPADRPAVPLQTLGHFELLGRLGVGGFGSVWKAHDNELDRFVAIKIPRRGQLDPAQEEQFLREARVAAQLRHPNIVPVHEIGREGETIYIVSDFISGVPLSDWLIENQPTFNETAELCAKVSEALHHAHQAGVVHRDLKPSNIMIDDEGQPHIMDFGLAKREVGEITMTADGTILGTAAYMSPEQAQGLSHFSDRRSDIYSMGVTIFQMLTGELPFRGSPQMLIMQVVNEEPPQPRRLNRHIPADLETICLKCLEKDKTQRFATADELAAEFRRYVRKEPIHSRPITSVERAWRWSRRYPWRSGFVALLALVALVSPPVAVHQNRLYRRIAAQKDVLEKTIEKMRNAWASSAESSARLNEQVDQLQGALAPDNPLQNADLLGSKSMMMTHLYEQHYRPRLGQSTEPQDAKQAAMAHMAAGLIARSLNRDDDALRHYEAAIEAWNDLGSEDLAGAVVRSDLANCYIEYSQLKFKSGDTAVAQETVDRGIGILQELASEGPFSTVRQLDLAESYLFRVELVESMAEDRDNLLLAQAAIDRVVSQWPEDAEQGYRLLRVLIRPDVDSAGQ